MAASSFMLPVATISLALLFFLPNVQSQSTGDCSSVLLQLAPCGPFVQGSEPSPAQFCCNTLRQLNSQQVSSLCLMLNDPSIGAFAVNKSLAFELPDLCNLPDNMSACSGMPAPLPPSSPTPQVSLGAKRNDTVSASPIVKVKPRFVTEPPISGAKLNVVNHLVVAFLAETIFIAAAYTFQSWSIMFL